MEPRGEPALGDAQDEAPTDEVAAGAAGKDASDTQKHAEIFIGGLARDTSADEISRRFGEVGEVTEVRMRVDSEGLNKGYAFVRYKSAHSARRATEELATGVEIRGKVVSVLPAEDNDTLFLGNISRDWTKDQVLEKLAEYKVDGIVKLLLMEDKGTGKANRGFGFLEFSSHAAAAKALRLLFVPGVKFGANIQAKVTWAAPLLQPAEEDMAKVKSVFIDGLPASWTQETVQDHFASYGPIVSVVLSRNMPNAKRKGYGFINFAAREAAEKVIVETNGKQIGSGDAAFTVSVKLANPPTENRGPRGGRGGGRFGCGGRGGPPPVPLDREKAELLRMLRDQAKDWEKFNPDEVKVVTVAEAIKVGELELGAGVKPDAAAELDVGARPETAAKLEAGEKSNAVAKVGAGGNLEAAAKVEAGGNLEAAGKLEAAGIGSEGKRKAVTDGGGELKRAKGGVSPEVGPMGEWLAKAGAVVGGRGAGLGPNDVAGNPNAKLAGVKSLQTGGNARKQEVAKKVSPVAAKANVSGVAAMKDGVTVGKIGLRTQNAPATSPKPFVTSPNPPGTIATSPKPTGTNVTSLEAIGTALLSTNATGTTATATGTSAQPGATASAPVDGPSALTATETGPAAHDSAEAAEAGPVNEKAPPVDTTWDCPFCTVSNTSEAELIAHKATRLHKIVERLKSGPKPVVKTPLSLLHEYSVKRKAELVFDTRAADKSGPFEVTVTIRGGRETGVVETVGTGIARDKKKAKQACAVAALLTLLERSPEVEAEFLKPPVDKNQGKSSSKNSSRPVGSQPNQAQGRRSEPPLAIAIQAINRSNGNGRGPSNGSDMGGSRMGGRGGSGSQRGGRISPGRGGRFGSRGPGGRGGFEIGAVNSVPLGVGRREPIGFAGVERGYEDRVNVDQRGPRQRTNEFPMERSGGPIVERGPGPSSGNRGRGEVPGGPGRFRGPLDNTDAMRAAALVAAFGFGTPAQTQAVSGNPSGAFEQASQRLTRNGLERGFGDGLGSVFARPTSLEGHVERALGGRSAAGYQGVVSQATNPVRSPLRNDLAVAELASWQQTAPTGGRSSAPPSRGSAYATSATIPYDPSHPSIFATPTPPPSQSHSYVTSPDHSTGYSHSASSAQQSSQTPGYAPVTQTSSETQRQTGPTQQPGQPYGYATAPPPQTQPNPPPQKAQIYDALSQNPLAHQTPVSYQEYLLTKPYPAASINPPPKQTATQTPSQEQYQSGVAQQPVEKRNYGSANQNPFQEQSHGIETQNPPQSQGNSGGVNDWYLLQLQQQAQPYTSASQTPAQQYTSANQTAAQQYTSANQTPGHQYTSANQTPAQQYTSANQTPSQQYTSANQMPAQQYSSANQPTSADQSASHNYTSASQTPGSTQEYSTAHADPTLSAQGADKLYGVAAGYGQTVQQGYAAGYGNAPPDESFAQQIQTLALWNSQQTSPGCPVLHIRGTILPANNIKGVSLRTRGD